MTPEVPGSCAPAEKFEAPLGKFSACHHRTERECASLKHVVAHVVVRGADSEARTTAAAVMRYFDGDARHHHADEEEELFPALLEAVGGSDAVCLRELTESLAADHCRLSALWQRLRAALQRVVEGETVAVASCLSCDVEAFISLYERHIEREERELLPMAARLLSDSDLDRIGRAMRARRGIDGSS